MNKMKHVFAFCLSAVLSFSANAQWTTNGSHIYNTNSGNVGIGTGTTTPSAKLYVNGDARVSSHFRIGGHQYIPTNSQLRLGSETDNDKSLRMSFISHESGGGASYIDYGRSLYFRCFESGTTHPLISFSSSGGVSIGWHEDPNMKRNLTVNGKITANEVMIKANVWADYVFAKDYQLPTLHEVKLHIERNKHLPGIPAESEVLENGVDLGEMQVKLLQKIEELTLYAIQQQEMIEKLHVKIEKLEKE